MSNSIIRKMITTVVYNQTVNQASKYFVVGALCTLLDIAVLFILTNYFGLNYILSSIISFTTGSVLNYILCIQWIFDTRVVSNQYKEFLYYLLITGFGLLLNTVVIWIMTEFISLHYLSSKIVAIFITYWWNFGARKYFLHTPK